MIVRVVKIKNKTDWNNENTRSVTAKLYSLTIPLRRKSTTMRLRIIVGTGKYVTERVSCATGVIGVMKVNIVTRLYIITSIFNFWCYIRVDYYASTE